MAPRISLVPPEQAPLLARPYYADGEPSPIVAALAQVPELLDVGLPFIAGVLGPTAIPARTKEVVVLRTSSLLECRFCIDAHSVVALDAGLSTDEIRCLRDASPPEGEFEAPSERALLRWIDALAGGTGPLDDAVASDLAAHFQDHEVVELTLLLGTTLLLNRFCTGLGLPTSGATIERLTAAGLA